MVFYYLYWSYRTRTHCLIRKKEKKKTTKKKSSLVATRPLCETRCPRYQYPIVFHQPITIYMHIILLYIFYIFIQPYAIDVLNSPHDGKTNIEFDFTHIQLFFVNYFIDCASCKSIQNIKNVFANRK